jgi:pyridoxine 5-phosphate synthase
MTLGVNIDHIAVLREARKINDPDPLQAVGIVSRAGADQITIHLREDRRHIHDEDARKIIENSPLPVNLECAIDPDIIDIVCELKPHRATLVPEKREEVTTEGGLDVVGQYARIEEAVKQLRDHEIEVSLFVDPNEETIAACAQLNVEMIELHTGTFANIYAMLYSSLPSSHHSIKELELPRNKLYSKLYSNIEILKLATEQANSLGLLVAAGHGLNYQNVKHMLEIEGIIELNIGQSIIARSVFDGLERAVRTMKEIIQ